MNCKRSNLYDNEYGYENKSENDDVRQKSEEKEANLKKEKKENEERKDGVRIDNWMDSSIDKNHYEKRGQEYFYDNLQKIKEREKEKKGKSRQEVQLVILNNITVRPGSSMNCWCISSHCMTNLFFLTCFSVWCRCGSSSRR